MRNYYINGIGCVSAQDSSDNELGLQNFVALTENVAPLQKPDYKKYIKPTMIRRMSVGVKMGVVASSMALKEANLEMPEAIITGSGMGCLRDSEKFLKNIIDNEEQFLTPTAFIQSTHNTVGGQIALGLACKAYNVTYVHDATSFETSLIDGMMILDEGEQNVLVGGVDEIGNHTTELHKLIDRVKKEETLKNSLLNSKTKGSIYSEGSQFFVLEDKKKGNCYAQLLDVTIYNKLSKNEVTQKLEAFLMDNNLTISDIDVVVLGLNGEVDYDAYYTTLQNTLLVNTTQVYYKHFSGEYNTASAFGMWTACTLLKSQKVPGNIQLNDIQPTSIKNVVLYNQYRGENHSFVLLKSC